MKLIQLRRWDNFKVIFEGRYYGLKHCLDDAVKHSVDLSYLNLRDFDISGCDLSNANLKNADFTNTNLSDVKFEGAKIDNIVLESLDIAS